MTTCNYTKGALKALLLSVYAYVCGFLIWGVLFNSAWLGVSSLYRDMDTPEWRIGLPLAYLYMGIAYSFIYCVLGRNICCNCPVSRGVKFGVSIWLAFGVSGAIFTYVAHPVPPAIAVAHLAEAALFFIGGGIILSLLSRDQGTECRIEDMTVSSKKKSPAPRKTGKRKKSR